jgi:hemerythrin
MLMGDRDTETMLAWSEQYETGHPVIDAQHRMLISYINRLEVMSQRTGLTREDFEYFLHFVEFLEDYTLTHFNHEEKCMLRYRCPAHQDNVQAHKDFLDFYRGFGRRLGEKGCGPEVIRELYDFCSKWIRQHILKIDVQLKPCQVPVDGTPEEPEELDFI